MLPSNLVYPLIMITFLMISLLNLISFFSLSKMKSKKKTMFWKKNNFLFLSLFISFDSHTTMSFFGMDELNWFNGVISSILIFYLYQKMPSRMTIIKIMLMEMIVKQFKIALKSTKDGTGNFFNTLFISFLIMNLVGLIPNVFTSTSHITLNLIISFPLWLGFLSFGWMKFTNKMFQHLVPLSTPYPLISFMVLIELISTLIRPGTLAIRLMANMISGHLLLTLLGNSMMFAPSSMMMILILVQSLLMTLELAVSMIQAYVFCVLLTLYSDESEY